MAATRVIIRNRDDLLNAPRDPQTGVYLLQNADMQHADLRGVDLRGAQMQGRL